MNERIAKALIEDLKKTGRDGGKMIFHDNEKIYTIEVTVQRELLENVRKNEGTFVSAGPSGSPCGCCGGSGRS